VLAGRKAMNTATYTTQAKARADSMFNVNFQEEDYGTSATSFTSSADEEGKVSGTARTTVPMVIMDIFGAGPTEVTVQCSADIQVPNIDIVLVLDVTGSMDSKIGGKKKIDSLKEAAKDFYETLEAAMVGNTTSQIRYGLVPYAEAVNAADLFDSNPNFDDEGQLPLTHITSLMSVQSRVAKYEGGFRTIWRPNPNPPAGVNKQFTQTFRSSDNDTKEPFVQRNNNSTTIRNDDCDRYGNNRSFQIDSGGTNVTLYPNTSYPNEGNGYSELYRSDGQNNWQTSEPTTGTGYTKITFRRTSARFGSSWWSSGSDSDTGTCQREVTHTHYIKEEGYPFSRWIYKPVDIDVSSYKSGGSITYATAIDTDALAPQAREYSPVELAGLSNIVTSKSSTSWNGCIEERETVAATTFAPIPNNADDLNYNEGGTSSQTRWRPALRDLTYDRKETAWQHGGNYSQPATS